MTEWIGAFCRAVIGPPDGRHAAERPAVAELTRLLHSRGGAADDSG